MSQERGQRNRRVMAWALRTACPATWLLKRRAPVG